MDFDILVGGGTTPPADGFSVCVANNLPALFSEEGAGSGLIVSFDIYDNTDGDPNNGTGEAPAIDVFWNGISVAHTMVPVEAFETFGAYVPISIKLDPDGTLDVVAAGTPVYTDLPTGFRPIAGAAFGIGARTGGLNEKCWIDRLQISAVDASPADAEAGQTVHFNVSNDKPGMFSVQPAISPDGTLTYSPAPGMVGTANVTVTLMDDGGTAYGGKDTSPEQTFTISVVDFTPPQITCPPDQNLEFTSAAGALVSVAPVVSDACDPAVDVVCVPPLDRPMPIGMTTVRCTATDNAGNAVSCTFKVTVVGPMAVKDGLVDELLTLLDSTTRSKDRDKLIDAITKLLESLDPSLWAGNDRLERKHGDKVFDKEREAVRKLCDLLKDKDSTVPDAAVQAVIDDIFKIDRTLAEIAINDAIAAHANQKKIDEALKHLAKGDEQVASNKKCDDGVNEYKEAWKKAVRAKVEQKMHRLHNGKVYVDVLGEPGVNYMLQVSSDLTNWTNLRSARADNEGYVLIDDPGAPGKPMRFYRVVEQE
jgi:hypothetical protein